MIPRRLFNAGLSASGALIWQGRAWAGDLSLAAAVAGAGRSPKNVARDKYRHPAALLEFFGLKPGLSVIEIEPGAGYWTEILGPYLKGRGIYRVAIPPSPKSEPGEVRGVQAYLQKLTGDQPDYGDVIVTGFADGSALAPAASVDLVLSFRNLHDWMADGTVCAKLGMVHAALKSGGVFGIEDHRGVAGKPQDPWAKSGYVREDYAVGLIEAAGFRLAARSSIGDNPNDMKNYPKGVWTLPPVLAMGAVDRAKYLAIGESDRWTMRFVKPG